MKKILIVILSTLLLISCSDELKFVCTEISYTGTELSSRKIQKMKNDLLGSKATLHFYVNSVKLYIDVEGETIVLDKRYSDDIYEYSNIKDEETYRTVLTPDKWFSFIRGFTLKGYLNGHLEVTVTYKRDEWTESVLDFIY